MSSKVTQNITVTIDGITPTLLTDFNWDVPPQTVTEEVKVLTDNANRYIPIEDIAEFTLTMKGRYNEFSSDPQNLMDLFGMRQRYAYYDIVNDCVIHSSVIYDVNYEEDDMLGEPRVPIELRQTEANETTTADDAGYNAIAFKFIATGNDFELFRFKAYDTFGLDVTSIKLECWTDTVGEPDAIFASTNTVTEAINPDDGVADWITIDNLGEDEANDLLDGEKLTVGESYWMVLLTNHANEIEICGSTSTNLKGSGFMRSDDVGATWGAVDNSLVNGTFIVQMYQTYGGHTVEVKQYNQEKDKYMGYRMEAVRLQLSAPIYETNKAVSIRIKGFSNEISTLKSA